MAADMPMDPQDPDLFILIEPPLNPTINPQLTCELCWLEIDEDAPQVLQACTCSGHICNILDQEISNKFECSDEDMLIGLIMTQYKKGIKVFGNAGINSVKAKMQQLHDEKIPKGVSQKQFNKVLEYLMFLKEKWSGIIEGHGCADGRPQCLYTGKGDSASSTVMTESVLLTAG